ncbi:MAG: serine hydrolase [Acidobacteria bacterium]|nr:serine hydrolase [Acidobacteriota bacterium]
MSGMHSGAQARVVTVALTFVAGLTGPALGQVARTASDFGAQGTAKVICSAVFVSGRDLDDAVRNSTPDFLPPADRRRLLAGDDAAVFLDLDRQEKMVRVTAHGFTGRAKYYGDQGCVILPPGAGGVFFDPVEVRTTLPDAMTQPWPMGDAPTGAPWPAGIDRAAVTAATDAAFADGGLTAAFVVVHKGRIIAERYGQGADRDTQLESWSMGKSLTATLLGLLVEEGHLGLHDPAPVPLWRQDPEDPRSRIRVSDLMRMSSGLLFTHASQPRWEWGREIADHLYIYAGGIDAFHLSITRAAEFPPNTVGRYRNSDPLTIGYIIRHTVERMGKTYLTWPQQALFDRIGIREQVMEPDPYGNFLLTGFDYGTGRNWARLGLLYLQDGMWNGERLLPEGWAEFVSTPAPAWDQSQYGGLFWVNGNQRWTALPRSAYYMSGAGGQHVIIVPTHDLVVVRMGHRRGQRVGVQALDTALGLLLDAIEGSVRK